MGRERDGGAVAAVGTLAKPGGRAARRLEGRRARLAGTPCRVTVSDTKVRPLAPTRFHYPDVMYATLESLREYALVSRRERLVEIYRRDGDGWSRETLGEGDALALELAGGTSVPAAALCDGGPIPEPG